MSGVEKMDDPFAPKSQPMPDCMMPDGAEPCAGFRIEAERHNQEREANNVLNTEIEGLRSHISHLEPHCDKLTAEIERLRVVIVIAKDALSHDQSMQWIHNLLGTALHRDLEPKP